MARLWISSLLLALLIPTLAFAQGEQEDDAADADWPTAYAARPMNLPALTLRGDATLAVAGIQGVDEVASALALGAGFGITDDFEVGGVILPLSLSPDFDYNDMVFYARYRLLEVGPVQLGVQAAFNIPIESDFLLTLGVPVQLSFADFLRIDTGAFISLMFDDVDFQMIFPARLDVSVLDNVYVGGRTGFITDFDGVLVIPLVAQVGYTVGDEEAIVDIEVYGGFPFFFSKAAGDSEVLTEVWTVGVNVRLFVGL